MPKYEVVFVEKTTTVYEVEAETEDDAILKAPNEIPCEKFFDTFCDVYEKEEE